MVGLISCGARKRQGWHPAGELYIGPYFKKARAYIQARCDEWAILSAKHGLLMPDRKIQSYEQALSMMSVAQRTEWAWRIRAQLLERWPERKFLVIAGSRYLAALEGLLFEAPFAGMPLGKQMSAMKKAGA